MISKYIRERCETQDLENMQDDRWKLLEEAAELDHIWGMWEEEAEHTSDTAGWLQQVSQHKGDH